GVRVRSKRRSSFQRARDIRRRGWSASFRAPTRCRRISSGSTSRFPHRWVWRGGPRPWACWVPAGAPRRARSFPPTWTWGTKDRPRHPLLFDRGGVKRGILPNEEMGRALVAGQKYTLVVDDAWRDAGGQPPAAPFRREFHVGPAQEHAIDPAAWRFRVPPAGTRDPLVVSFPAPLDYGLLHRAVRVSTVRGEHITGDIRLEAGATRWLFPPREPWQARPH